MVSQGKKYYPVYDLSKAIWLIETQIDFARWKIKHVIPAHKNRLKWTGSIVAWVELIYALHASGHINNGKVSLKEIFAVMGESFGFEVEEFSRVFIDIKHRTDDRRTKFMDLLKDAVLGRMEESDRKPYRK